MYSKTRRRVLTAVAVACVGLGGYLLWPSALHFLAQKIVESRTLGPGKTAPDFTLKDARGAAVKLSSLKGKVVILNFWATWCGPCKTEIPWFIEFEKTYAPRGFTVLGVSMDEDGWTVINPYVAASKVNYPIVLGNETVNQLYGGFDALPTTLVIARDGKVAFLHEGLIGRDEYEKEIRALL
ncbi:MAG TPA: redoxin domain-containing protein [Bryobacteraceae bacterium]|jgi:peroxiredoxin|nr:redoxin domain-containing protein [Bryobacteraceae bacterium]